MKPQIQDALAGAVGGALGTLAMGPVGRAMFALENEADRQRERKLRTKPPYQAMAEKASRAAGRELTEEQEERAGTAIHWAYGLGWGALYGVARKQAPALAKGAGLPFATLFFVVGDEGVNWIFGTTPPPRDFPWQAHARGLATHAAFTAVTEVVCRGLGR